MIRIFACLATVLFCVFATSPSSGQMVGTRDAPASFVEAPRYIQQELRDAEFAIGNEDWSDAVVRLGDLLQREITETVDDDLIGQDFFVADENARATRYPVRTNSLLRKARRLVASLPVSARDTYELRYGPLARKTLSEASEIRDWESVRDVRRKYFHTKAGYEASLLLAQHEMYLGHPLAASLLLDDVVNDSSALVHLGDAVRVLHAAAITHSGRDKDDIRAPAGKESVVGGESANIPKEDAEFADWIATKYSAGVANPTLEGTDYPMFGKSVDRNGGSLGQMPLENVKHKRTSSFSRAESALQKYAADLAGSGRLAPPSMMPIRVGNQLLMRTKDLVYGINYENGLLIWAQPVDGYHSESDDDDKSPPGADEKNQNKLLYQRVWNDLPYGQITSDGRRVFALNDLNEVDVANFSPIMGWRGTVPANSSSNTLHAYDLPTEGKAVWYLGKKRTTDELSRFGDDEEASNLDGAFFLGPPLPLDGRLYVMAEVAGDILLLCLDPATGDEIWRQQLAHVGNSPINTNITRRIAGATPTYHEGLLLCPTGAGMLVAVDLVDRMLRWGVTYRNQINQQQMVGGRTAVDANQLMQRWHIGTGIAADDAVFVTPIESNLLHSFELLTGEKRFERARENNRFLAGIRNGQMILVGTNYVTAYDSRTGARKWKTEGLVTGGQQIAGRGMFGKDDYFVPTTGKEIVRVSLTDGKISERRKVSYELGNLVAAGNDIISQGVTTVVVARGEATLEPLINSILESDPKDLMALIRKAELLIQRRELKEAMEILEVAKTVDAEMRARRGEESGERDIEVTKLSIDAMLGLLRESPENSEHLIEELDSMIDRDHDRRELISLQIEAALKGKELEKATSHLIRMSEFASSSAIRDMEKESGLELDCSLDNWIAARVSQVLKTADDDQLEKIDGKVRDYISRQIKREPTNRVLTQVLTHFAGFSLPTARKMLSSRLLAEKSFLTLERFAMGLGGDVNEPESLSGDQLSMLAKVYASGGMRRDATRMFKAMTSRKDLEVDAEEVEDIEQRIAESKVIPSSFWSDKVALKWQELGRQRIGITGISRQEVIKTRLQSGEAFRGWRVVSGASQQLKLRNPLGNMTDLLTGLSTRTNRDREAIIDGGVLAVVGPGEVTTFDLMKMQTQQQDEAKIERRSFTVDGSNVTRRRSIQGAFGDTIHFYPIDSRQNTGVQGEFRVGPIVGDRIMILQGGDLMAVDLQLQQVWRNGNAPPHGMVLSDGKRVAVVSHPLHKVVFFDAQDGAKLGEEKWEHGVVWAGTKEHVLCYAPTDDPLIYTVKVVDPFESKVLIEMTSPASNRGSRQVARAFGRIVNGQFMVLYSAAGKLTVWDIVAGKELCSHETKAMPDLVKMNAMQIDGKLIVMPNAQERSPRRFTEKSPNHVSVSALHGVSLDDGELLWSTPLEETWGCTLDQPAATPIIVLTCIDVNQKRQMGAMAISTESGKIIHRRENVEVVAQQNELATRLTLVPVRDHVIVDIFGQSLDYSFGDTDEDSVVEASEEKDKPEDQDQPAEDAEQAEE